MTDCTPKDGYAGCNFKQTGRLDSCREPGGCLYALGYGQPAKAKPSARKNERAA